MIEFIRGNVAYAEVEYLVLDVNGVGYQVYCSHPYRFVADTEQVLLYTHQYVREDALLLYGFVTREELRLFRQLLEVSGIGPKVALGILSAGQPNEVLLAIQQENITFLTRLPGIGKKTAQRIILDLKDKTKGVLQGGLTLADLSQTNASATTSTTESSSWLETKEALRNLGYSEQELNRTWLTIQSQGEVSTSVDQLLKQALNVLYQA